MQKLRVHLPILSYVLILLVMVVCGSRVNAQYYHTGSVTDNNNTPVPFVQMRLKSTNGLFQSGNTGGFGIPSALKKDWVICFAEGYDTLTAELTSGTTNILMLMPNKRMLREQNQKTRLNSLTRNLLKDPSYAGMAQGESYNEIVENGFVETATYPSTGFSPNANNASYSNIRRFLNNESQVTPDAVRIEEMLNYFSLSTAKTPTPTEKFEIDTRVTDCPWNSKSLLLFVNAQAQNLDLKNVPPANLVFLIDNSASMEMPNRLPLLQFGFKMLVKNLRDIDRVAIVTYGGSASIALPPTYGSQKEKINAAIQAIEPGGATPGSNGIQLAYELAMANPIPNGNNRVILATDGDFNVGITDEKALEELIESYKNTGIYLTCLGVGMGNYKDSKIEVLARHGNGNFAYLDKELEAEKVLVKELTQNLYAVASDVTVHLDLNAALVKNYRLIGYDNRKEAIKDASGELMGVEIGSGNSMVSVIEFEPTENTASWRENMLDEIVGSVKIRYRNKPENSALEEKISNIPFNYIPFPQADARLRFASAVTMFGTLLRRSPFAENMKFENITSVASGALDTNDPLQTEFLQLVETARKLYNPEKKKKWGKKKED
jgi:Ca-activated chloride channel family protein